MKQLPSRNVLARSHTVVGNTGAGSVPTLAGLKLQDTTPIEPGGTQQGSSGNTYVKGYKQIPSLAALGDRYAKTHDFTGSGTPGPGGSPAVHPPPGTSMQPPLLSRTRSQDPGAFRHTISQPTGAGPAAAHAANFMAHQSPAAGSPALPMPSHQHPQLFSAQHSHGMQRRGSQGMAIVSSGATAPGLPTNTGNVSHYSSPMRGHELVRRGSANPQFAPMPVPMPMPMQVPAPVAGKTSTQNEDDVDEKPTAKPQRSFALAHAWFVICLR